MSADHDHDDADHDHSRIEGPVPDLPDNPDLQQLRARAKELRRGAQKGNPTDLATITRHHPDGARLAAEPGRITLREAQLALAAATVWTAGRRWSRPSAATGSRSATCTGGSASS
jgi:hypothetical protein